jgi:ankyrin repeat protein
MSSKTSSRPAQTSGRSMIKVSHHCESPGRSESGAKSNDLTERRHYAASKNRVEVLRYFIVSFVQSLMISHRLARYSSTEERTYVNTYPAMVLSTKTLIEYELPPLQINARDKANQCPLHRAATIARLPSSRSFSTLRRLPQTHHEQRHGSTQDRVGNTPLHLAMESGHGDAAILLIKKGADRGRVCSFAR